MDAFSCTYAKGGGRLILTVSTARSRKTQWSTHCFIALWEKGRRAMEQCIGRRLRPENVPDIMQGPEQELLPYDISRRQQIVASVKKQRLAFGRLVEMILEQEDAECVRQARGERVG